MDMQGALRARITGDVAVAAIVWVDPSDSEKAVYWVERPQLEGLPAVTLQIVTDVRTQHLQGFDTCRGTLVQVDCWGDKYGTVAALTEAVLAAIVPEQAGNGVRFLRATNITTTDMPEEVGNKLIHRSMTQLTLWWSAI